LWFVGDACDDDDDGDRIDATDNCALISKTDQKDTDSDGVGDVFDDADDDDDILVTADNRPIVSNTDLKDTKRDGFLKVCDSVALCIFLVCIGNEGSVFFGSVRDSVLVRISDWAQTCSSFDIKLQYWNWSIFVQESNATGGRFQRTGFIREGNDGEWGAGINHTTTYRNESVEHNIC
jgi:hypothetical protein